MTPSLAPESEDFLYWDPETIAWYPDRPPENQSDADGDGP